MEWIGDMLFVIIGGLIVIAWLEWQRIREQERAHAAWVREWQWQHRPRTWGIIRTRHRRMDRYHPRHAAPMPLPLDDMAAQLRATGQARCVRIGGKYR